MIALDEIRETVTVTKALHGLSQKIYNDSRTADLVVKSPLSPLETRRKTELLGLLYQDIVLAENYVSARAEHPIYQGFVKLVDEAVEEARKSIIKLEVALQIAVNFTDYRYKESSS